MKTLALYLPQFHRVPENDAWWGEGFTEWTAVKGAEKMFAGHNQPRVPLNNNYYNLLEHDTMEWQSGLMKEYCVDGMCIYHYWFKDGRRIHGLNRGQNLEMLTYGRVFMKRMIQKKIQVSC